MDEKLKNALELSNLMVTLNNSKRLLRETYNEKLLHYTNGGRFVVTRELITFVKALIDLNQSTAVLLDDDGEPIVIEDLSSFLKTTVNVYTEASNFYAYEYKKIIKQRSVSGLLDL